MFKDKYDNTGLVIAFRSEGETREITIKTDNKTSKYS